ncbi:MAG: Rrf2 family transcriptional regulator [Cyclobacteriaceae bacterium]
MKASTNYSKAVHICIYLNIKDSELINSTELADSVKTNPVVIRRLVSVLRKHGILGSIPGASGGFYLKKTAKEISLWDIYLATREEEFFKRPKVNPECVVSSNLAGLLHDSSIAAELSMKSELSKVSISDLSRNLMKTLKEQGVANELS